MLVDSGAFLNLSEPYQRQIFYGLLRKPGSHTIIKTIISKNAYRFSNKDQLCVSDERIGGTADFRGDLNNPRPKWSVHAVPCSVHCSYTAAYAVYLQYRLLIHC